MEISFSNSNDLNVCLSRDAETGVVTVIKEKNTSDLKISISDDKIVILKDTVENFSIPEGKIIELDIGSHTLSNDPDNIERAINEESIGTIINNG